MMKHRGRITLFVPESGTDCVTVWRRYVISRVSVHVRRDGSGFSGEIYVFDRDSAACSSFGRCNIPAIFPGCAVLDRCDDLSCALTDTLPDGCYRVLSAEHFDGGSLSHVKLVVG